MTAPHILLLAKSGQLGWELNRSLLTLGKLTAVQSSEIDLEDPNSVVKLIRQLKPDCIINPAAYTAVDQAETETERARKVNAIAPGILAEEAKKINALLIHYSTDYVFDGRQGSAYVEEDAVNPINLYGLSKLEGERAIQAVGGSALIFRTSWVYSLRLKGGFVNKVLQWSRQQPQLRVVTDQIGNPTWARMLAEITAQITARGDDYLRERTGLYHLAGGGFASRFEWAQAILAFDPNQVEQITTEIIPVLTDEFPLPAKRPLFSALDCAKFEHTFNLKLPDWKTALQLSLAS